MSNKEEVEQEVIDRESKIEEERGSKEKPVLCGQMLSGDPPEKSTGQGS
jgi:hypothetical protein